MELPKDTLKKYQDKRITKKARDELYDFFYLYFGKSPRLLDSYLRGDSKRTPTPRQYEYLVSQIDWYYNFYVNQDPNRLPLDMENEIDYPPEYPSVYTRLFQRATKQLLRTRESMV